MYQRRHCLVLSSWSVHVDIIIINYTSSINHSASAASQNVFLSLKNLCASNPCVNNGKCLMGFTNKKYLCVCKIGFTGENCENGNAIQMFY